MKYTITRQFSFTNELFEVVSDSEVVSKVKATPSKQYQEQFDIKLPDLRSEHLGENPCMVKPDKTRRQTYLIYSINNQSNEKVRFGELSYKLCNYDDYLYTIIIGQKLYKVRSSDLKYRRLVITDIVHSVHCTNTNQCSRLTCPETLYQVIDSFSKANEKYHINVHDREWPLGYFAITILLHLHESQRYNT